MIQIFGTSKCKATRAAQRFFADRSIKVQSVELREKGLSKGELASVARAAVGADEPAWKAFADAEKAEARARARAQAQARAQARARASDAGA